MKPTLILVLAFWAFNIQLAHCQEDAKPIRFNSMYFHLDPATMDLAPAHFNWGFQGSNGKPGIELRKTPYGYRHSYKMLTARSYFFTDNFFLEQALGRAWGGEIEGVVNNRITLGASSGTRNAFREHAMWKLKPFGDIGIKINLSNK